MHPLLRYNALMTVLQGLLLGAVQGITEFLPVSSSGHLILARDALAVAGEHALAVDAILHLATALAVLVYFRSDIARIISGVFRRDSKAWTLALALAAGTVPAALIGLLIESYIESTLRGVGVVIFGLLAGSALMAFAERFRDPESSSDISVRKGILVGCFQVLALIPGMSRSGMTISGGLLLGLSREEATRFAFLLSFPIILGAGSLKLKELYETGTLAAEPLPLALAGAAAFLCGIAAIHLLIRFLRTHSLMPFVWYRLALAALLTVIFVF